MNGVGSPSPDATGDPPHCSDDSRQQPRARPAFRFRPDPTRSLTAVILAIGAALFGAITWSVHDHGGLTRADPRLLREVVGGRHPWLTPVARLVTDLGIGPVVYAVVAATGVALWYRTRDRRSPVLAVAILALGQSVRVALNHWIARPRPPRDLWLVDPSGYAYPSGHTTTATIGYGLAAILVIRTWPRVRIPVATAAAVIAIAVGLSRIYLGVHWPSDVAGGWTLGVVWLALVASAVALVARRTGTPGIGLSSGK